MSYTKRMLEGLIEQIDTYASSGYCTTEIARLIDMDVRIVEGFIKEYLPQYGELVNG